MMITDERLTAFINSLDTGNPAYLNELEKEARETNVPIIRTETQSLLRTLIAVNRPERILEVGTAVGFSALCMSEYAPEGCQITTIEKYEKRIPVALENFRRFGKSGCIQLLAEDAAVALKKLKGSYDFIFMDAAKGQYMNFLPDVLRLLRTGGLMVSDNVLQDGDILESRYAVTRRDRTIHMPDAAGPAAEIFPSGPGTPPHTGERRPGHRAPDSRRQLLTFCSPPPQDLLPFF